MQPVSQAPRGKGARLSGALGRLWRGEVPLGDAFWYGAIIGGLIVNGLTTAAMLTLFAYGHTIAALLIGYGCAIPYNIVAGVGLWRSGERYPGSRHSANIVRIIGIVALVAMSMV